MNLSKKLLLLNHMMKFIKEQYELGQSTEDVLGMLRYKSKKYSDKQDEPQTFGSRKIYLTNYILYLNKRVIDFQYFRKRKDFKNYDDLKLFELIHLRDRIIFNKIFKD